jgi:hypothetical protein
MDSIWPDLFIDVPDRLDTEFEREIDALAKKNSHVYIRILLKPPCIPIRENRK